MKWLEKYRNEIKKHNAKGYHVIEGLTRVEDLQSINFPLPNEYKEFVSKIGYGCFFSSYLRLFGFSAKLNNIGFINKEISAKTNADIFIFGDNGGREGYYCFNRNGEVCWVFNHDWKVKVLFSSFSKWIESEFSNLFSIKSYSLYTEIKDIELAQCIIAKRQKLNVALVSFDKERIKKTGEENVLLARYNRLVFSVFGTQKTDLDFYTVKCIREGSIYKSKNVEYVSIPLERGDGEIEVFLFDPFNVEFTNIVADCSYYIDLTSKMRIRYKELAACL